MNRLYLNIIIIASEKQKGSQSPFTYHTDSEIPVVPGAIVYVPFSNQIVIGIVIETTSFVPAFTTKSITSRTPFRLTDAQLALATWMSRHYLASLATVFGLFVTTAVVPAPERRWQVTTAGLNVDLHTLPEDERGLLYLVRQHHVMSERDIASQAVFSRATLAQLRKWLVARGHIQVSYHVEIPEPALPTIKMIRYVNKNHHIALTATQQALLTQIINAPNQQLPVRDVGKPTIVKRLIDAGSCEIIDVPVALATVRNPVLLSADQQHAAQEILSAFDTHRTFLLDGVTGSGKTEVYFALIDECLKQGKQVLVLVPEIALTTQLAARFSNRFPGRVGVIHGQITAKQRRQQWYQSLTNTMPIIIGPRSALYVPQPSLGLIVVDEEHDASYKSEFTPYINARDAAVMYAKIANIPVVLGSATPSIEVMHAISQQRITHLTLPERLDTHGIRIDRPSVRIIDMRSEQCVDSYGVLGHTLATHIATTIDAQHHVLLLLNRRGNSGTRMCRACGAVSRCFQCSTPMSLHLAAGKSRSICHTCGAQRHPDSHCRECFHSEFVEYGSGTQRVVEIVQTLHPDATVVQWDRDTADSAHDHRALLAQVETAEKVIIVGTQMIAKGLDLPKIRLVGVINTDIALHLPDFRAAERTYQLLTQVAGRAGRRHGDAHVIFQSYQPDNYAIQAAARYQSQTFYAEELAYRKHVNYPPFQRMVKLIWTHSNPVKCEQIARNESNTIMGILKNDYPQARIIGPTPAFFMRIRGMFRWQAVIVAPQMRNILDHIAHTHHAIVDVDPVSLL